MGYCHTKILGIIIIILYIIFLIIYVKYKNKNYEYFTDYIDETFYYTLANNQDIDILNKERYIYYGDEKITGFIGQYILFDIFSKLKRKKFTVLRYPDFRNEIKRHSKKYFDNYFLYLNNEIINKDDNYIFDFSGFHGIIDNKVRIWVKLMETFSRKTANEIMGTTYLIPNDKQLFLNNYIIGKKYILKNSFGGARSALKITNDREEIINYFNNINENPSSCEDAVCHSKVKYNIVQDYIEPTFLMKGLKFGLRMFLIITNNKNSYNGYVYSDGYCYYSVNKYKKDSTELEENVVGAISKTEVTREKYNLPESYKDFEKYVIQNIDNGFNKLKNFQEKLCEYSYKITESNKDDLCIFKKDNIKSFMIYAMDIEIDSNFKPFIFEANVYFTRFDMKKRLGHMISNMYNDIYYKLGLSKKEINGMWKIN
tara:strand:- start:667 stop:1947 length:1281 start_codon:yes stop_codon:yes gene_type:complete